MIVYFSLLFLISFDHADARLQSEFEGIYPRALSIFSLTSDEGMKSFEKLFKEKVVTHTKLFNAISLYADLQVLEDIIIFSIL